MLKRLDFHGSRTAVMDATWPATNDTATKPEECVPALMLIRVNVYNNLSMLTLARMRPRLELEQPILRSAELDALKRLDFRGWRTAVIDATWPAADGASGLEAALQRICDQATAAIEAGHSFLVLSDRAAGADVTSYILSHNFLKLPGEHAAVHVQFTIVAV